MNVVILSPHFPPNYVQFSVWLRRLGVNVLGIADEPYEKLSPELREALAEYYYVDDMHNYDQILRACGHFTHRHGKIDRFESHNEYWLETDARIRTDFNVYGIRLDEIPKIRYKSQMKKVFEKAGIPVARGVLVKTPERARRFVGDVGYPVVAKPDGGVGAAATFKIHDDAEMESFFGQKPDVEYIMEEFVEGEICTFDGLTDRAATWSFSPHTCTARVSWKRSTKRWTSTTILSGKSHETWKRLGARRSRHLAYGKDSSILNSSARQRTTSWSPLRST